MNFLKKHYEKLILTASLLFFVASIVGLIAVLGKTLDIKEDDLRFPVKPPDYKKKNGADFDFMKGLENPEFCWSKPGPRSEKNKVWSDIFTSYQTSKCPNAECRKLIPSADFTDGGKCPACGFLLHTPEIATVPVNEDADGDGMPDKFEQENGLNPADPSDASTDLDKDGFDNLTEYKMGTKVNDPKSRPPFGTRFFVVDIKRKLMPIRLTRVSQYGDDNKQWTIQIEVIIDGREKTKFLKIGDTIPINDKKFLITDAIKKTTEEYDKSIKGIKKKDVFTIVIQTEGGQPVLVPEKTQVWESKEVITIKDPCTGLVKEVTAGEKFAIGNADTGIEEYTVLSSDAVGLSVKIKMGDSGPEFEIKHRNQESESVVKTPDASAGPEQNITGERPAP